MKNQWRLLLRRRSHTQSLSSLQLPSTGIAVFRTLSHLPQVTPPSLPSLSSLLCSLATPHPHKPASHFDNTPSHCKFSSEASVGSQNKPPEHVTVIHVFSKFISSDEIKQELDSNNIVITSDLVFTVLKNLNSDPDTAIRFFEWVLERKSNIISSKGYNIMLEILGRYGFVMKFRDLVESMKKKGYVVNKWVFDMALKKFERDDKVIDLEKFRGLVENDNADDFVKVLDQFVEWKIVRDSVDLYESSIHEGYTPSASDLTFLLRKIVSAKEFDMELFTKVLKVFKEEYASELGENAVDAVMKSLICAGRLKDCSMVLDVLFESGLKPTSSLRGRIAFILSRLGRKDEACVFMEENLEVFNHSSGLKTLVAIVQWHCVGGDLEKASHSLKRLVEKGDDSYVGYPLRLLVNTYCNRNKAVEACELVCELIEEKGLKPEHSTYKSLIKNLLSQGGFNEALELIDLMKNHGFPPYVDPLIDYVSRKGMGDDAMMIMNAMTAREFPSSKIVFVGIFEAFFKSGRYHEAQSFLAQCPEHIKNHVVLFYTIKSRKTHLAP